MLSEVAAAKVFPWPGITSPAANAAPPANKPQGLAKTPSTGQNARTVAELASPESRFFLKSEWGPISEKWPALSFSKRSVGDYLNREYNPARDFILYAGTSNPERTEIPGHRQRLLSIRGT